MSHPSPQDIAVAAAELLFANTCIPGCRSILASLPAGLWECRRWAGHEDYGIDHQASDGTT